MPRALRIASGLGLALLIVTCTDRDLSGPRFQGRVGVNLQAFRAPPGGGQAPIPIDTITVSLTQIGGPDALDTAIAYGGNPVTADSLPVVLNVRLKQSSETFALQVTVKGGGFTWYVATDTVTVVPGRNSTPPLTATLVGPGHNAGALYIGPQDSTVVPGLPVSLYASVSDSFEGTLTGVPVGFRLQNPALGTITYPTYLTPTLVPKNPGTTTDTTWLIGETPNHIVDSTQIYISPRSGGGAPAEIFLVDGDAQVDTPKAVLAVPLTVLVADAKGVPVGLAQVAWQRTGLGTLVSGDTVVADSFGYARMTYQLPASIRTDTVTASIVGFFAGPAPSVTFTERADTGQALTFDTATYILGKSQVSYSLFVTTRIPTSSPLTVQIGRSDSTTPAAAQKFGIVGTTVTIPAGGQLGCCVELTGNNLGTATLIGHAAGYQDANSAVIVTTPLLVVDSTMFTYTGTTSVPTLVFLADSTGALHYTANDLVIRDSSSDTTIAKPDSATVTVPAGNFYAIAAIGGVRAGTTSVTFRAPNYPAFVTQVEVDTAFLFVYAGSGYAAGLGQTTTDNYMYLPASPKAPLVVSLTSSNPSVFTVPATVTLYPDSSGFVDFPITGTGLGTASLTVHAPGFVVSDSVQALSVNTPVAQPVVASTVSRGVKTQVYVYAEDTLGFRGGNVTAPLAVTLATNDPNAVWDSTHITIQTGTGLDSVGVIFNSTGQFTVTAAAPGYTTGNTLTNASAPPVGVSRATTGPRPLEKVVPRYPDSLRRKVSQRVRRKPAPPRR